MVRAEGGSLRFWGPGLLSTSPAFSMSSASHSAGSSGWLAQKTGAGPLSSGQGMLMPFVDPDRIEQSDRVQAASFAVTCHKCSTTSTTKTDSVNGQIYSNTFHARYSRAPLTFISEVGRPSTTALKETKGVRSEARYPFHFHTTLLQYRSKSAATQ